jgi:2-(1,2-epoxy-1,2-dihydrophenyl)acetyl-CoA isomerase
MPTLLSGPLPFGHDVDKLRAMLQNGVLTLTLNQPERANAFNIDILRELKQVFERAACDSQTRVIVLTGVGRAFGAGQDIQAIKAAGESLSYREMLVKEYNPLILLIRRIEKPVIAAVNGPCAGGSLGLALACDFRIAADRARFVVGFGGIALVPDMGVSLLLPALIGLSRALEFYATNAPITAEQALAWGLVNKVFCFEALMKETLAFAEQLAKGPQTAFALTKRAFNQAVLPDFEQVLKGEADLQEMAGKHADHKEGVAAFLEKRKPKFN